MYDNDVIDQAFEYISNLENVDSKIHFIYCGSHYRSHYQAFKLAKSFVSKRNKYGIQSSILTMLSMRRINLITKEHMKHAYKRSINNRIPKYRALNRAMIHQLVSINDDLESFFSRIQEDEFIVEKPERVQSFFLPKLNEKELKLVENRNSEHFETYSAHFYGFNADVDFEDMLKSNSKAKYLFGSCQRFTFSI